DIKLAYLPNLGRVRLRLTAKGVNEEALKNLIDAEILKLHQIIGDIIYGYEDDDPVEVVISKMLVEKNWTLSTAESCTGGRLASKFTKAPGSSASFKGSVVSYSTEAKSEILNVPEEVIKKHSVVSAEVAKAMALGAQQRFHTDFAISTTGNAGPTKGDSEAELGTVFIGIATPKGVTAREFNFGNHRERVIGKSVNKAMELLQESIIKLRDDI
ncbi:MAG TPA: nicotinamide-nucleotide amidohydrolase family protein, partial [Christiangramia sp.]|nr:nicotinamide-nucleotide amidohydrolase family protein [Christiangramia sp.]